MALLTPVSLEDADRVARAHGLGACASLEGCEAGSVNTNYFLETDAGRRFLRVYEEQDVSGVAYEWALLEHLARRAVPVPRRVPGPAPGQCRVAGKCVAVFELAPGEERCQSMWGTGERTETGRVLGLAHRATMDFGWRRPSRFGAAGVRARLDAAERAEVAELEPAIERIRAGLDEAWSFTASDLPRGVVHGDLFRDNVRFAGTELVCVLDWESAATGVLVFDLMVAVLALTYGDGFDWEAARALVGAYDAERPLAESEWLALRRVGVAACQRFAATRITDFFLRARLRGEPPARDYRRFLTRMDALEALDDAGLAAKLRAV